MLALFRPLENMVQGISAANTRTAETARRRRASPRRKVNIKVKTSIIATGWMAAQRIPSRDRVADADAVQAQREEQVARPGQSLERHQRMNSPQVWRLEDGYRSGRHAVQRL